MVAQKGHRPFERGVVHVTFVANCRDIFFPVPFPPSPFGFGRLKIKRQNLF